MGWKANVKGRLDSGKGRMKIRLLDWGCTMEHCRRRQEEMQRCIKLREEQKGMMEKNDSAAVAQRMESIDRQYEEEMERLQGEMLERMRQKQETERLMGGLTEEEREFIQMRYGKGYGFDFIAMKLHMSRATLFRVQDKILEKLLQAEKDETK